MCYSLWYNAPTTLPATSRLHRGCIIPHAVTQSNAPEDGQNNFPKHVELTGIINKPLLLQLVGCLYYLYQWCTVKQISNNEIYLLIKYIKSVLWRVAKQPSYIEDARCLKVKSVIKRGQVILQNTKFKVRVYSAECITEKNRRNCFSGTEQGPASFSNTEDKTTRGTYINISKDSSLTDWPWKLFT